MTDTIDDEAAALQHLKVAFEHLVQARARLTQEQCKKLIADHMSELGGQYFVQHFSALASEAVKSIKAEDTQKNLAREAYLRANGITHSSRQIPPAKFFARNIETDPLVDPLLVVAQEQFAYYFRQNYDALIHDPDWHAPRIFHAARSALEVEREAAFRLGQSDMRERAAEVVQGADAGTIRTLRLKDRPE